MSVSVPVTILTGAGPQLVSSGAGRIVFMSTLETSGVNVATFTLFDGTPATNQALADWSIDAAGSTRDEWPNHGLAFEGDLWVGNTVGAATLRIHVVPEDVWHLWVREMWEELANLLRQGVIE